MNKRISVYVITLNAAKYLHEVLQRLEGFDEVFVCDMGSADRTIDIAESHGCKVLKASPGDTVADMRLKAVRTAKYTWLLGVRQTELVSPQLRDWLYSLTRREDAETIGGAYIPRRTYQQLRYNPALYPDFQLRFMRREGVSWPDDEFAMPRVRGKVVKVPASQRELAMVHIDTTLFNMFSQLKFDADLEVARRRNKHVRLHNLMFEPIGIFLKYYVLKGNLRFGKEGFIGSAKQSYKRLMLLTKLLETQRRASFWNEVRAMHGISTARPIPDVINQDSMPSLEPNGGTMKDVENPAQSVAAATTALNADHDKAHEDA